MSGSGSLLNPQELPVTLCVATRIAIKRLASAPCSAPVMSPFIDLPVLFALLCEPRGSAFEGGALETNLPHDACDVWPSL